MTNHQRNLSDYSEYLFYPELHTEHYGTQPQPRLVEKYQVDRNGILPLDTGDFLCRYPFYKLS